LQAAGRDGGGVAGLMAAARKEQGRKAAGINNSLIFRAIFAITFNLSMRNTVIRVWKGELPFVRQLLLPLLYFASLIYGVCLKAREAMYRNGFMKINEMAIPVVSVGNITLGGTGKTPVVEKISRRLKEEGFSPAIITRGYGREKRGIFPVNTREHVARDVGDEAYMLARKNPIPVVVGSDRAGAVQLAMERFGADVAILDDGFQRRDIRKDLEILILSGSDAGAGKALFPLGSLREPITRVKDADVVLVSKDEAAGERPPFMRNKPAFRVKFRPLHLFHMKENLIGHYRYLEGKRVLAFSGLGDNESFFSLLGNLGARVVRTISFADHHRYTEKDMDDLRACADAEMLVTTEKDAVKIQELEYPQQLFYLAVEMEIEGEERLFQLIREKIERKR